MCPYCIWKQDTTFARDRYIGTSRSHSQTPHPINCGHSPLLRTSGGQQATCCTQCPHGLSGHSHNSHQTSARLLLDYIATYSNDGIVYRARNMFLCAHADARFLNESKAHSRAGSHIYLTEDDPFPRFNGAVLSIAQIIICYGICRQIQASRPLRHRKRNDTPPPNPHRDGLASTKKSYPDG